MTTAIFLIVILVGVGGAGMIYANRSQEASDDGVEITPNLYAAVEELTAEYPSVAEFVLTLESGVITRGDYRKIEQLKAEDIAADRRENLQAVARETLDDSPEGASSD